MKVLIAEDDATSRLMLDRMLRKWGYDTVVVEDGLAAWEALQESDPPRLAILDWRMPGMLGTEICRRVRSRADGRSTYLIMLTAKDQREDIIGGFKSGADDYLTKPFDRKELRARLEVGSRILSLQGVLADRLQEIEETLDRIQELFLFGECPRKLDGGQVSALTIPCSLAAGDFYDFHQYSEHCFDVVVGDVMGKGMKAALFGAATVTRFLRSLKELILRSGDRAAPKPSEILTHVRAKMWRQLIELESFVTINYSRFDLKRKRLEFVDCGHLRVLHVPSDADDEYRFLEGANMPLGFSEHEPYEQTEIAFEQGDLFLYYSDGITEARDPQGRFFGTQRLVELVREHRHLDSEALVNLVMNHVEDFAQNGQLADDATCIAVQIRDQTAEAEPPHAVEYEFASELGNLPAMRQHLRRFAQRRRRPALTDDDVVALELAVNEAAVNIIKHAYKGQRDKRIVLRLSRSEDSVQASLLYWGEAFEPEDVLPPTFDEGKEGGLGLFIIGQVMDHVQYDTGPDGSCQVKLTRRLGRSRVDVGGTMDA